MSEFDTGARLDAARIASWADELRAMAALGLLYSQDAYDLERYRRLGVIAAEMLGAVTDQPATWVADRLAPEIGYITVKVGVAAAVFDEAGRQLLVQRKDNRLWAQPGGWADVGEPPAAMAEREVLEETGLIVTARQLVGLYDSHRRGFRHPHHLYHLVFNCGMTGGEARVTEETRAFAWFEATDPLPPLSPGHASAVQDAFRLWAERTIPTVFD
jgi:ADP-ribose pyrophosphatase YjhB (NUDIX family)